MYRKSFAPFLLLGTLLVLTSLACNAVSALSSPTNTPVPTNTPLPTDTPVPPPTATPLPAQLQPTAPPAEATRPAAPSGILDPNARSSGDILYTERFTDLSNWTTILMRGDQNGFASQVFDNRLRTEIETQDTWVYYILESGNLSDVQVDIQAENRASNTNFVGILCRYTGDRWYEVNILNSGYFYVYYVTDSGGSLDYMYEGATYAIRMGRKTNDYSLVCRGELLTVYINGEEAVSLPLRTGDFPFIPEGQAGLSVSTSNVIPVVIDFLQFALRIP